MSLKSRLLATIAASVAAWFGRRGATPSQRIRRAPTQKPHDPLYNRRAVNLLARLSSPRVGVYQHGTERGKRWARKNRAWSGVGNPKKKRTALGWNRRAVEAQLERQKRQLEKLTA